jgi:hypothetical protein
MKTPGFSAEVVLDPAIQHKHYGGLFTGTSDQTGVIPQLSIADILNFLFGERGGGGGGGAGVVIGAAIGGAFGGPVGAVIGGVVGREVGCLHRTGRLCD